MIFQEEQIFRKSMAYESGIKMPVAPEDLEDEKALAKYEKQQLKTRTSHQEFLVWRQTEIELSIGVGWVLCTKIRHRINSTSLSLPGTCKS
jgi:hypothetical protein